MEGIQCALLVMCRERDSGNPGTQGEWVREYLDALKETLTEKGIQSFDVEQLRIGYVSFILDVRIHGLEGARERIPRHLQFSLATREQGVRTPADPRVVPLRRK